MNVENNLKHHQFEAHVEGDVAFLSYRMDGDTMVLEHTRVPKPLEGRGIASSLATAAFDYARSNHLRVVVVCPYVQSWLERHPEQRDLVI
ncbi:MAG TPA: GNAT family N-acetyltransferase [Thermoanaerobaculia bacterium]|nr:GNAT family N-acetyltransferase [Thermoanaerobaculia bacterium]